MRIAIIGDLCPFQQLHHKVRPAGARRAPVEDLRDIRMVQEREGLPPGFEAPDDLLSVHPQFDDLQSDQAVYRFLLLGLENHPKAALANPLEQPEAADAVTR